MGTQQGQKDEFTLCLVRRLDRLLEKDRAHRLLDRPCVVQGRAYLVLDRSDDLKIELPDDLGDVTSSGIGPGQVYDDGGNAYRQQYETRKRTPEPDLPGMRGRCPLARSGLSSRV